MTSSPQKTKPTSSNQVALAMANMVGQIGCATSVASIIIIGIFFLIGRQLDLWLGTKPWIMLGAIFASFPITLYVIVRISLASMERAQQIQARIEREQQIKHEEMS